MTLPTTINDIEDLYRILEACPQWREALRRQLLTPELLAMPDTLAQLSLKMDQLIAIVSELSSGSMKTPGKSPTSALSPKITPPGWTEWSLTWET